ncbi:MAG: ribonuclease HII [Balneolaceae bacterium]|nr:ribonuclease HII [Balneolaceae bacterium]
MIKNAIQDRLSYEKKLWAEGFQRVMGLDEVGRGCLAGPVVAAGVIFHPDTNIPEIRDSKKIAENERVELVKLIKEKAAFWTIQERPPSRIDEINILWASIEAMRFCAEAAKANPDYLLVDGNRYTTSLIPHTCVVKGDDKSMSIGAASILAKVHRDSIMAELHKIYPEFGWDTNVGYPTPIHKKGLKDFGFTPHHRKSFKLGTQKVYKTQR